MIRNLAIGLAVIVLCGTVFFLAEGNHDRDDLHGIISASKDVMLGSSFTNIQAGCSSCTQPMVTEYAPPDRFMVSGLEGNENWAKYLYLDGKGYVSSEGERWLDDSGAFLAPFLLRDPRLLLRIAEAPQLQATEVIDGEEANIVAGELDWQRYLESLPQDWWLSGFEAEIRPRFEGALIRFWIDADDYRVLQVELQAREGPVTSLQFDYRATVSVPDRVESMSDDEARTLRGQAEANIRPLILAIEEYKVSFGIYPSVLDPAVLSAVMPPTSWPTNPFTGQSMGQSTGNPGDYDYTVKNEGVHYQLRTFGWDGDTATIDTERLGGPFTPRPLPP